MAWSLASYAGSAGPTPTAIGVLGLFIAYQVYRLSYHFSIGLLLLTIFDAVIVGLTWREYLSSREDQA